MKSYSLSHLSDEALGRDLRAAVSQERTSTAVVVAHIAEFDARKLYLPAAYPSMFAYCVGELRLSEDAAAKRLRVARAAQRFPGVLVALAEGRVHLGGLLLLAPYLAPENEAELIEAATHKTRAEIEHLLAERLGSTCPPASSRSPRGCRNRPGIYRPRGRLGIVRWRNPLERSDLRVSRRCHPSSTRSSSR